MTSLDPKIHRVGNPNSYTGPGGTRSRIGVDLPTGVPSLYGQDGHCHCHLRFHRRSDGLRSVRMRGAGKDVRRVSASCDARSATLSRVTPDLDAGPKAWNRTIGHVEA